MGAGLYLEMTDGDRAYRVVSYGADGREGGDGANADVMITEREQAAQPQASNADESASQ